MPKLPRGMAKKRHAYYLRIRHGHKDRWIPLGSDYSDAKLRYDRLRPQMHTQAARVTVKELSERWLKEYVRAQRNSRGQHLAEQRLEKFVLPLLGARLLAEVTPADVWRLRAELQGKSIASRTVHHILSDVRCLFRYAVTGLKVLTESPFESRMMPQVQEEIPEPLTDSELGAAIAAAPTLYRGMVRLAALTGLRYGELRGLTWPDVRDLPYPQLLVHRSHRGPTKSKKVRPVPLSAHAQAVLRGEPRRSEFVFPGRDGTMAPADAWWINKAVSEKVKGFHFHRLRHTFATRMLSQGCPVEVVQSLLGHSTVRLTERYARLRDDAVRENVERYATEPEAKAE